MDVVLSKGVCNIFLALYCILTGANYILFLFNPYLLQNKILWFLIRMVTGLALGTAAIASILKEFNINFQNSPPPISISARFRAYYTIIVLITSFQTFAQNNKIYIKEIYCDHFTK